ncbi:zinc finger MYM-type protein 1-like [Notolabrus celidotus]|uniref:zinc finger MYM-type protein 1-like n=1 Tax=Notolabrus celidotus TaxID=1203425 RepID=UPI00148F9779|nr:zinc finger MYM-type protein 1-like [Notolabrus celidotus]
MSEDGEAEGDLPAFSAEDLDTVEDISGHPCQCYNGVSVMSGCNNGVQEKLRKEVPQAIYIHCYGHKLNLVLVDCHTRMLLWILFKLICISLTLPVTSVSCERSFSCLRRLKTYLRNSSGDCRTSNLALLAINTDRTRALDRENIINAFALIHKNRRIVLL